jgi:hypothetical protein
MGKDGIRTEIDRIRAGIRTEAVFSRQQRQAFWTQVVDDPKASMADRLRASELLGRSEADFTDNVNKTGEGLTISVTPPQPIVETATQPKLSQESA